MHDNGRSFLFPVLTVCLFLASSARSQNLPEGKGKAEFTRICGQCHGVEVAIKTANTPDGWAAVVDDMISRGAQGSDDDFDLVTKYLSANFFPKVKMNKASEKEISSVLGLSSEDAAAIVHYRETQGSFKDLHDLEKVPHLDMKKLEDKKNQLDFSSSPAPSGSPK
jgi:competence protein ComEA